MVGLFIAIAFSGLLLFTAHSSTMPDATPPHMVAVPPPPLPPIPPPPPPPWPEHGAQSGARAPRPASRSAAVVASRLADGDERGEHGSPLSTSPPPPRPPPPPPPPAPPRLVPGSGGDRAAGGQQRGASREEEAEHEHAHEQGASQQTQQGDASSAPPPRVLRAALALDDTLRAVVDEQFLCANLDFWPPDKCGFGGSAAWMTPHVVP
jgi:hypothetical protein